VDRTISSFQYHIYTTMYCSLSCQHCFIDKKIRQNKESMSVEQFKKVVDVYVEHFSKSDADKAEITIIGGEPTTVPAAFYNEVMPYLKSKFEETGKFYYVSIVTNFLHAANLSKFDHHFDVIATSYEPLRFSEYNSKANADKKSHVWLNNVKEWIEKGKEVSISIATTKDVVSAGTQLLDDLLEHGIRHFQFNMAVPEGEFLRNILKNTNYNDHVESRKEDLLTPVRQRKIFRIEQENSVFSSFEAEAQYMIDVTKWYLEKRQQGLELWVYPIESYSTGLENKVVIDDIACCVNKGLNTRVDGETTGCATEIGSVEMLSYANIYNSTAQDIIDSPVKKKYMSCTKRVRRECMKCEFYQNCQGACMLRGRLWDSSNPNAECHGLRSYLEYLTNNIDAINGAKINGY